MAARKCSKCGVVKSRANFYNRDKTCKECRKKGQKEWRLKGEKRTEPFSTELARNILAERGIPCVTGKAAGYTFIDLAAWGCVPIEAKGSANHHKNTDKMKFVWQFSPTQFKRWFPDDTLILFIGNLGNGKKYTWVTPAHAVKERMRGRTITLTISSHGNTGNTIEWFNMYRDRFDYIERARQQISIELADG